MTKAIVGNPQRIGGEAWQVFDAWKEQRSTNAGQPSTSSTQPLLTNPMSTMAFRYQINYPSGVSSNSSYPPVQLNALPDKLSMALTRIEGRPVEVAF